MKKQRESNMNDCCACLLTAISWILVIISFPFSLLCCMKYVYQYERVLIFRMGRLRSGGARGPGIVFVLPCVDDFTKVDLRTVTVDVPPQQVLSKDSLTVSVDAVVFYRIYNSVWSVTRVERIRSSTSLMAQTMLRNIIGTKTLRELLANREDISHQLQVSLDRATDPWGVKVERVEMTDVRLPLQMQRAMAAEAESTREAKAKVISAEGEQKASEALKNAALVIAQSPGAIQLRYLQTLTSIAANQNETIIFPLPMDLIREICKLRK